ncbi:hypothetical protein OOK13_45180 [Streptomyces sp. NBC_00378]|uniref:hypothetical protein n=1 Tax=Streptomyces sp. NBC_00378 TaxID=2975732 RepID=UPI0022534A5C|nr:hypothetical protein [Streptomyces sp. NBC_00378]MCX5115493.1 hypothetical protein [Streptomyces sp. NBC_00378]
MSADVTDLLASIDDVLEAVTAAPAPAPAPAPDPAEPVVAGDPAEAPVEREDRWDSLYDAPEAEEAEGVEEAVAETTGPLAPGSRVSRAPRLPYWWEKKKPVVPDPRPAAQQAEKVAGRPELKKVGPEGKCGHASLLALRAEADRGDGEVIARLCLDCDERLPATDPEPKPDCEHEERLEARSESGKLIGYVCAAEGCGARLTVEEVHGRVGKWLRPATRYYPRLRNPFSTTGADGEEVKPALSAGTLRLLANAGAAGAGYGLGLVPLLGRAIEECERTTSIGGALVLGGGVVLFVAHVWDRKTRHWRPITAWVARIPLASAITALALYAPASQI